MAKVLIQIDKREPLDQIRPIMDKILRSGRFDIEVKYESMIYGDYYIKNGKLDMLIERKEISDFVGSHGKGDLKEKLFSMRQRAARTALLIEGHYATRTGCGDILLDRGKGLQPVMRLQTYVRFMTSQLEKQTWLYYTNNLFETLITVVYLAEYMPTMMAPNPSIKAGNPREWLVQLPGVASTTLTELQSKYNSPAEALQHIDEWADKRIMKILKEW